VKYIKKKKNDMKKNLLITVSLSLALLQLVLVSIMLALLLISCSEPIITQLSDDSKNPNNVKVEIIADKPAVFVYANGYDSTGILQPVLDKSTFISVSGIKNTNYGKRAADDYYFTQFSDKNYPIMSKDKNVIGFTGVNMGEVRFNNLPAQMGANKIQFHDYGNGHRQDIDTIVGLNYSYSSKQLNPSQASKFPYNTSISFKLDQSKMTGPNHDTFQFEIPTPIEVTGKVKFQGSSSLKNLEVELEWNGINSGEMEIVLGVFNTKSLPYPLIRLTGNDNGKIAIPRSIVEKFIADGTQELLVTFIRKKVKEESREFFKDNYIVAQSIHNIKIQLP
jgi:hypothetical protein